MVRVPPMRMAEREHTHVPAMEFAILFEDEHLLIIDKPAGVAVHGGSGISHGVIEQLRAALCNWRLNAKSPYFSSPTIGNPEDAKCTRI